MEEEFISNMVWNGQKEQIDELKDYLLEASVGLIRKTHIYDITELKDKMQKPDLDTLVRVTSEIIEGLQHLKTKTSDSYILVSSSFQIECWKKFRQILRSIEDGNKESADKYAKQLRGKLL